MGEPLGMKEHERTFLWPVFCRIALTCEIQHLWWTKNSNVQAQRCFANLRGECFGAALTPCSLTRTSLPPRRTETLDKQVRIPTHFSYQPAELGIVHAHRLAMQWCTRRFAATRASLTRFFAWLAATRLPKVKAKKGAMITDDEVEMGRTACIPSISSEGPRSSDSHKHGHGTHLLDVRDPRVRFQNAVLSVIKLQRTTGKHPTSVGLGSWWHTPMSAGPDTSANPVPDAGLRALRRARISKVIEELKALDLAQELFPHAALVRHIQFSPSGKYLATSGWGHTSCVHWGCHLIDRLFLFFFLACYQLGQNCDDFSCWGAYAIYFF